MRWKNKILIKLARFWYRAKFKLRPKCAFVVAMAIILPDTESAKSSQELVE